MAEYLRMSLRSELKELITCPLCKNVYKSPVILPCIHTFCKECVQNKINTTTVELEEGEKGTFNCPTCHSNLEFPGNDINSLPQNDFVNNLKNMSDTFAGTEVCCDFCLKAGQSTKAPCFCVDCGVTMCEECKAFHPKLGFKFLDHRIIQLLDCKNADVADICGKKGEWCPNHDTKELEFYCRNCDLVICSSCQVVDHQDHVCIDSKRAAAEKRRDLATSVGEIKEHIEKNNGDLQWLSTQNRLIEEARTQAIENIRADQASVNLYCEKLESEVNTICDSSSENINSMIRNIHGDNDSLQSGMTISSDVSRLGRKGDVISMANHLTAMLLNRRDRHRPMDQPEKPVFSAVCYQAAVSPKKMPSDLFGKCKEMRLGEDPNQDDTTREMRNPTRTYRERLYDNRLQIFLIFFGLLLAIGVPVLVKSGTPFLMNTLQSIHSINEINIKWVELDPSNMTAEEYQTLTSNSRKFYHFLPEHSWREVNTNSGENTFILYNMTIVNGFDCQLINRMLECNGTVVKINRAYYSWCGYFDPHIINDFSVKGHRWTKI